MIEMPWDNKTAPNVMIEVTDACNIQCRACYKRHGTMFKSLEQVKQDIEDGARLRQLHTITISGGEPTLHPDLFAIVRLAKQKVPHVFLLTNGVLLNGETMRKLKTNGLDSILFHVDTGQERPDIPGRRVSDILGRLTELCREAHACGLDVAVSATLYDDEADYVRHLSDFVICCPDVTFLFISRAVSPETLLPVGVPVAGSISNVSTLRAFYRQEYGLEPFAGISAPNGRGTTWLSYFIPIVYRGKRQPLQFAIHSNGVDLVLMKLHRFLVGRYIHRTTQRPIVTFLRTAVNAVATLRLQPFSKFLMALLAPGGRLRHKMIAYDGGPSRLENGDIVHCEYCPTAIVRNGALLPCCTADYWVAPRGACQ